MTISIDLKPRLEPISIDGVPEKHPISVMAEHYCDVSSLTPEKDLPSYEDLMDGANPELKSYFLLLEPTQSTPHIDFIVRSKGKNIPGIESEQIAPNELYSQQLSPETIDERLMELTSTIVLKSPRFTKSTSARRSTINMKIYRATFPVWQVERQTSGVILMIAAPYAELTSPMRMDQSSIVASQSGIESRPISCS